MIVCRAAAAAAVHHFKHTGVPAAPSIDGQRAAARVLAHLPAQAESWCVCVRREPMNKTFELPLLTPHSSSLLFFPST